jgi:hypothetical protein
MVNSAPGFIQQPSVINGFSDLILEVFGPIIGAHWPTALRQSAAAVYGGLVSIAGARRPACRAASDRIMTPG